MRFGYSLSCEEHSPHELVEQAMLAEEVGLDALWISDQYHPWNDNQGQNAFAWSVIGATSAACELPVTTAVTCPTVRIHPGIVAQAAATTAVLLEGRFTLPDDPPPIYVAGSELPQLLPNPEHFEKLSALVTREMTRDFSVCRSAGGTWSPYIRSMAS